MLCGPLCSHIRTRHAHIAIQYAPQVGRRDQTAAVRAAKPRGSTFKSFITSIYAQRLRLDVEHALIGPEHLVVLQPVDAGDSVCIGLQRGITELPASQRHIMWVKARNGLKLIIGVITR